MKLTKIILGSILISSFSGCITSKESLSYIALGDSYTIGESVETSLNFPYQLVDSLSLKGKNFASPVIIARTGWRTDQLMDAINSSSLQKEYDLVTLLIGVNNEFQGKSINQYENDFTMLCKKALELTRNKKQNLYILSIPDYGFTPYGKTTMNQISERINVFNASNKRISDSLGLNYVEITDISRKGLEQPDLVADDGLHPSAKMYALWVREILKKVKVK
ncbi:SGNH/GDSL hydrolase family protein [Fluviicola taffensis]|uniref:Lipolytic protein G-D-S-L family n=1 Tax=Fluviicola taffensis (strain DSM 16823 / NCIMB 13979 / RW262) TaxID=755732 RepID=F2ID25_FLUTR|nr:SGNH/GDSL hydrolase family protein [Fluviicola taffensis]AEA44419.1 lipolytic protein G-D-S-L family [Fluviicola taffensis DSM 16823]